MDFRLTEGQRLVRDTARDFVDRELIPHVRDWEEKGEVPRSFYSKMAGLGFLGAPVPEKYGGAGMDYVSFMLLVARGAADDKSHVHLLLWAAQAWMETRGRLPINIRVVMEG